MSLSTDYAIRTGAFDPADRKLEGTGIRGLPGKCGACTRGLWACGCFGIVEELKERARSRYASLKGEGPEHLVTGSDDFTLFLWDPATSKKPLARMTGEV